MSEETLKLLEERVLEAVARLRDLRSERDRHQAECSALRARLEEVERGGARIGREDRRRELDTVRSVLREAILALRDETDATEGPEARTSPGRRP